MTYTVNFSEVPIILQEPLTFTNLETWLSIELTGYNRGKDFDYILSYNDLLKSIQIILEFKKSIEDTFITAKIN
jgi:hypothetical protein